MWLEPSYGSLFGEEKIIDGYLWTFLQRRFPVGVIRLFPWLGTERLAKELGTIEEWRGLHLLLSLVSELQVCSYTIRSRFIVN